VTFHFPDDVVVSIPEVIGRVALIGLLQRRKIHSLHPLLRHEVSDQTFHHFGMGEQELVRAVVIVIAT
jgi:hypothetical protein